jgi:iron(II)-dependent oxidoreductase
MIIGIVLGFACSAVLVLSLLTAGVLNIDGGTEVAEITSQPVVVTATNDPNAPTNEPMIITATPEPTTDPGEASITQPTPTDPADVQPSPSPTATTPSPTQATQNVTQDTPGDAVATSQSTTDSGFTQASEGTPELPPNLLLTEMVLVDGGTFVRGATSQEIAAAVRECQNDGGGLCTADMAQDSLPAQNVTIDSFNIEQYEVTTGQYVAFLNALGPGSHLSGCGGRPCVDTDREAPDASIISFDSQNYDVQSILANQPVVGVTWYGASAYCEFIGRRLPTEAEWERAARGPNNLIYPWGDIWDNTFARTNRPTQVIGALPVGSFAVNTTSAWGAYDMAGNVAEWVSDWWSPNYYAQPESAGPNPIGPASGTERSVRGGSWDARPFFARTTQRQHVPPDEGRLWVGFRCADDIEQQTQTGTADVPIQPISEPTQSSQGAAPSLPSTNTPAANPTEADVVPPGG